MTGFRRCCVIKEGAVGMGYLVGIAAFRSTAQVGVRRSFVFSVLCLCSYAVPCCGGELGRANLDVTETVRASCVVGPESLAFNFGGVLVGASTPLSRTLTVTCVSPMNVSVQVSWGGATEKSDTHTFSDDASSVRTEICDAATGTCYGVPAVISAGGTKELKLRLTYRAGGPGQFARSGVLRLSVV